MAETPTRRRAPGMSPEQRREMITAAALPLVAEQGASVTTSQIARAAGIGEATIFRVFADKDELLDKCMGEAARPDHVVREIGSISLDEPLAARLVDAADALRAHFARMGAVAGALHASGHWTREGRPGLNHAAAADARERSIGLVRAAVAELFEPENPQLRLPVDQVAAMFLGLLFGRMRPDSPGQSATEDLVDVFLHGALAAPDDARDDGHQVEK